MHVCSRVSSRLTQPCFSKRTCLVSPPPTPQTSLLSPSLASVSRSPRSAFSHHTSAELAQADLVSPIKYSWEEKEKERGRDGGEMGEAGSLHTPDVQNIFFKSGDGSCGPGLVQILALLQQEGQ